LVASEVEPAAEIKVALPELVEVAPTVALEVTAVSAVAEEAATILQRPAPARVRSSQSPILARSLSL
jgi:hypothetical protein